MIGITEIRKWLDEIEANGYLEVGVGEDCLATADMEYLLIIGSIPAPDDTEDGVNR